MDGTAPNRGRSLSYPDVHAGFICADIKLPNGIRYGFGTAPAQRSGRYRHTDAQPLCTVRRPVHRNMACNMLADEAAEGIDAFLQRRQPRWQDGNCIAPAVIAVFFTALRCAHAPALIALHANVVMQQIFRCAVISSGDLSLHQISELTNIAGVCQRRVPITINRACRPHDSAIPHEDSSACVITRF